MMGQTILTIFSSVSWIIAGEEEKKKKLKLNPKNSEQIL